MAIQNFLSDIHVGDDIYIRLGDRLDDNNNVVGDFYMFPSYMMHTVYPFSGTEEERRSVSFNANIDDKAAAL